MVATIFSSFALLSSSISTANLSCLLATTFSSLSFLSNSFSSPRFNLLRVARHCFSWSSVSDDLFFSSCSFLVLLLALSFFHLILSLSIQSLKLGLLGFNRPDEGIKNSTYYLESVVLESRSSTNSLPK